MWERKSFILLLQKTDRMKQKTCIGGGIYNFDIIVERDYPEGFIIGKRNKFSERILLEEVGGTCGNVMCMLPYLGVQAFPIAHFDLSTEGLQMKEDLKRYGSDVRFVQNSEKGGTTLLRCVHKLDAEGKPTMTFRATSPGSRFPRRKHPRGRDEAPAFIEALDFVPDVFFFDTAESGYRVIAQAFRAKGTLVYYEPEGSEPQPRFLQGVQVSDVIKFSGERITDTSFCAEFTDKLFIQTLGAKGLRFNLCGHGWQEIPSFPNDKVVDWEGAGDWTTAVFIKELCSRDILSVNRMTDDDIRLCLTEAQRVASRSVGFMGSKGMIHAG